MSAPSNDQLEEFFRKAAAGPEVSFNEKDWKKLEARLEAQEAAAPRPKMGAGKWAAAVFVASGILFSVGFWLNSRYEIVERVPESSSAAPFHAKSADGLTDQVAAPSVKNDAMQKDQVEIGQGNETTHSLSGSEIAPTAADNFVFHNNRVRSENLKAGNTLTVPSPIDKTLAPAVPEYVSNHYVPAGIVWLNDEKISGEFMTKSPGRAVKIKQKAVVDLPGAEEVDRREAGANVSVEHASVQKQHLAAPRLSLLLSFAPDFSSTSFGEYSGPGKAFGASLRYHVGNRWSVSFGAIKNYKQYTGSAEYYSPPKGYWKRNTNGILPSSIDGSCSLVEFPIMIQYAVIDNGRSTWVVGAGASSYLMQSESYHYNFEHPNPGAKEGWQSGATSPFMFNMINFTLGYERRILPGLVMGIEPYAKIPVERIGWSNLKLFSTGASITMRYILLQRRTRALAKESRPPD
jgi:hypothetical protein